MLRSSSNAHSVLKEWVQEVCRSARLVDTSPECSLPFAPRAQFFGSLPDVGGLLEQEPEATDVEQVQRFACTRGERRKRQSVIR